MDEATKEKIMMEVENWQYIKELPKGCSNFELKYEMCLEGDIYNILRYENKTTRRKVTLYYHDETKEYKVKTTVGLTEFCNIEFITSQQAVEEQILKQRLEKLLQSLAVFNKDDIDSIVVDKKILEWQYVNKLPETIEGFQLFIKPSEPLRIINGSYIVFDYCDFETSSNFIIYYNIFRDEFFGEAKIRCIPEMNYIFDSHELGELEEKLDQFLIPRLKEIRMRVVQDEKIE
ncbi:hypothetical protein [Anaerosinus massiliensis]|uniref:hypothetical protein n=1 Tax=Massilibacillus massiliensis TaxID=1806837 RepID=UPI000A561BF0|nr:hypothetical protein [Massilibacillus massiliensis]